MSPLLVARRHAAVARADPELNGCAATSIAPAVVGSTPSRASAAAPPARWRGRPAPARPVGGRAAPSLGDERRERLGERGRRPRRSRARRSARSRSRPAARRRGARSRRSRRRTRARARRCAAAPGANAAKSSTRRAPLPDVLALGRGPRELRRRARTGTRDARSQSRRASRTTSRSTRSSASARRLERGEPLADLRVGRALVREPLERGELLAARRPAARRHHRALVPGRQPAEAVEVAQLGQPVAERLQRRGSRIRVRCHGAKPTAVTPAAIRSLLRGARNRRRVARVATPRAPADEGSADAGRVAACGPAGRGRRRAARRRVRPPLRGRRGGYESGTGVFGIGLGVAAYTLGRQTCVRRRSPRRDRQHDPQADERGPAPAHRRVLLLTRPLHDRVRARGCRGRRRGRSGAVGDVGPRSVSYGADRAARSPAGSSSPSGCSTCRSSSACGTHAAERRRRRGRAGAGAAGAASWRACTPARRGRCASRGTCTRSGACSASGSTPPPRSRC